MARFDSVLSFSRDDKPEADQPTNDHNGGSDDDDDAGFEFAFAPPLNTAAGRGVDDALAPADDLFAHGRILPAYPVFERGHSHRSDDAGGHQTDLISAAHQASTAPPSPDTYCAWAPRSAPGSPAREFPKSASTGEVRRFWRLRDLVGGRSHSDGKEKFVFLQPAGNSAPSSASAAPSKMAEQGKKASAAHAPLKQQQKQSKTKKGKAGGAVTEMDMATAHRLFYGKQGAAGGAFPGGERKQHSSYLPYRTGIVGFFTTAHALGRSHHPY